MILVENKQIERRYESCRLKDKYRENNLLDSIRRKGIVKPLRCVKPGERYILLDGYKRLRCAGRLDITSIPVVLAGSDEAGSIIDLIRLSVEETLSIVEQAAFVDKLKQSFGLSVTEIAYRLERSKAWVSLRLGILNEMSEYIRKEVFSGRFPLRAYMYTLRMFTRVNKISSAETDRFVSAVSGKGLSLRNIEKLAYAYFRGGDVVKQQIDDGKFAWPLHQLAETSGGISAPSMTKQERRFILDMERAQKYLSRIRTGLSCREKGTEPFSRMVMVLLKGMISILPKLIKEVKDCYDWRKST